MSADGNERLAFDAVHFVTLPLIVPLKMSILLHNKTAGVCGLG